MKLLTRYLFPIHIPSEPQKHFIGIMRERAEAAGAKLKVASNKDEGTAIELEWVGGKQIQ